MNRFFVRMRPEIDSDLLDSLLRGDLAKNLHASGHASAQGNLFFDSARSGFKWMLTQVRRGGSPLRVGIQAFTCHTAVNAILEAGCEPVFLDIDTEILSTPFAVIRAADIDVLVLTCLAGIPNPEYEAIVGWCRSQGTLIIEDLAQTWGATVSGHPVGSLGEAAITSFGFDKPVSALKGGLLRLNDPVLRDWLQPVYEALPVVDASQDLADLARLRVFNTMTAPERAESFCSSESLSSLFVRPGMSVETAVAWLTTVESTPAYSAVNCLFRKVAALMPIQPRKMGPIKQHYLQAQIVRFPAILERRKKVARIAREILSALWADISFPGFDPKFSHIMAPAPARLAALVSTQEERTPLIQRLQEFGIETGAFNWPDLAFERIGSLSAGHSRDQFPGSVEAASRIVNLPIWSEKIWCHEAVSRQ